MLTIWLGLMCGFSTQKCLKLPRNVSSPNHQIPIEIGTGPQVVCIWPHGTSRLQVGTLWEANVAIGYHHFWWVNNPICLSMGHIFHSNIGLLKGKSTDEIHISQVVIGLGSRPHPPPVASAAPGVTRYHQLCNFLMGTMDWSPAISPCCTGF